MTNTPPRPLGWATVRLKDVADVRLGRQRSPKNHSGPNMRPYLRAANVTWSGLALEDVKTMHFSDEEFETYRLKGGDVLLSEASGSIGEVGKPAVWREQIADCCFQNTLIRVRGNGSIDPEFLAHRLRFEALSGGWVDVAHGVGIHHLGATRVAEWQFVLPPLAEQHRIVDEIERRLSHVEAAEHSLRVANRKLIGLRDSLEQQLVWDSSFPRKRLGDLLAPGGLTNGRSVKDQHGGFPVLRLTCLKGGTIDYSERKDGAWSQQEAARFLVRAGDYFVARGNGSLSLVGRGGLARTEPPTPLAYPDTLIRVRPNPELLLPTFLAAVWNTTGVREQLERVAHTTAGIYKVNQGQLCEVELPVPSVTEQLAAVGELDRRISLLEASGGSVARAQVRADQLRRSVLHAAFTGRLVPQDPSDEPAHVLLERIRARSDTPPTRRRGKETR